MVHSLYVQVIALPLSVQDVWDSTAVPSSPMTLSAGEMLIEIEWLEKLYSLFPITCCQLARLEKDKEELVAHYQSSDPLRDGKRAEALLREKTQLLLRLKGLEAEVAELHAQKEDSGQQAENVQRIQIRQLSESQAALKALEVRHTHTHTH